MRPRAQERPFQDAVIRLAMMNGWVVAHFRPSVDRHGRWKTAMQGHTGFPDTVLVHPQQRRVLFIELKSDTGRLSPAQRVWIGALQACPGVECHVLRPKDWPTVEGLLAKRAAEAPATVEGESAP